MALCLVWLFGWYVALCLVYGSLSLAWLALLGMALCLAWLLWCLSLHLVQALSWFLWFGSWQSPLLFWVECLYCSVSVLFSFLFFAELVHLNYYNNKVFAIAKNKKNFLKMTWGGGAERPHNYYRQSPNSAHLPKEVNVRVWGLNAPGQLGTDGEPATGRVHGDAFQKV